MPSGGAVPLRRPKRSLNTHPAGPWEVLDASCGAATPWRLENYSECGKTVRRYGVLTNIGPEHRLLYFAVCSHLPVKLPLPRKI